MSNNDQNSRPSALQEYVRASVAHEIFQNPYTGFRLAQAEVRVVGEAIGGAVVAVCAVLYGIGYVAYEGAMYVYDHVKPPIVEAYNAVGDAIGQPSRLSVSCKQNGQLVKGEWKDGAFEVFMPESCLIGKVRFDCERPNRSPLITVQGTDYTLVGDRTCRITYTERQPS